MITSVGGRFPISCSSASPFSPQCEHHRGGRDHHPAPRGYVTTGERKSAVDHEAMWPVRRREAALCERYNTDALAHQNAADASGAARRAAINGGKGDRDEIRAA